MTLKILLLGNTGQVGWELNRTLLTVGDILAVDYPTIDMADPDCIRSIMREVKPNLVVNATAYTDVDKAESEPELAMSINSDGPGILAEEAKRIGSPFIHFSTDYVFDGAQETPYTETDLPNPINMYGKTKLAGESAIQHVDGAYLIFRTSWVYSLRRPCFLTKIRQWGRMHETLRIVEDQVSSPTWARMLAESTAQIIAQGMDDPFKWINSKRGLYHLAGGGACSRYEWAQAILALDPDKDELIVKEILPAKRSDFSTPAERPSQTALACNLAHRIFGLASPSWGDALRICLEG